MPTISIDYQRNPRCLLYSDEIESPGIKIPCKDECGQYEPNYSIGITDEEKKKSPVTMVLRIESGLRTLMGQPWFRRDGKVQI